MTRRIRAWIRCGLFLSLVHAGSAAADTKAFVGARIFDGTGKAVIEKCTVAVLDGRIAVVGPSDKVRAPKGAPTINVTGTTITPGLINAHGHVSDVEGNGTGATEESVARQLGVFARYGITTVFSLGGGARLESCLFFAFFGKHQCRAQCVVEIVKLYPREYYSLFFGLDALTANNIARIAINRNFGGTGGTKICWLAGSQCQE